MFDFVDMYLISCDEWDTWKSEQEESSYPHDAKIRPDDPCQPILIFGPILDNWYCFLSNHDFSGKGREFGGDEYSSIKIAALQYPPALYIAGKSLHDLYLLGCLSTASQPTLETIFFSSVYSLLRSKRARSIPLVEYRPRVHAGTYSEYRWVLAADPGRGKVLTIDEYDEIAWDDLEDYEIETGELRALPVDILDYYELFPNALRRKDSKKLREKLRDLNSTRRTP